MCDPKIFRGFYNLVKSFYVDSENGLEKGEKNGHAKTSYLEYRLNIK